MKKHQGFLISNSEYYDYIVKAYGAHYLTKLNMESQRKNNQRHPGP